MLFCGYAVKERIRIPDHFRSTTFLFLFFNFPLLSVFREIAGPNRFLKKKKTFERLNSWIVGGKESREPNPEFGKNPERANSGAVQARFSCARRERINR
jgi:hypothetical protein